jgi:hypothetical protein
MAGFSPDLFECAIDGATYPLNPLDAPIGPCRQKDVDLGFYQVCAKPRQSSEFISVHSIVRGALIVDDPEWEGDLLVIDLVDTDMFLCLKAICKVT